MEGTVKIGKGADWCTQQIAKYCPTKRGTPSKCALLTDQVRICRPCLYELHRQEFPEDYEGISRENCKCQCHETAPNCEGDPWHCFKCGDLTKIDVIYMTRQQTERHPKEPKPC